MKIEKVNGGKRRTYLIIYLLKEGQWKNKRGKDGP